MTPRATFNRPLAILVAATSFMEFLDGTIIQTAAPAMARDFHRSAADLNVTMTVYLLALAVCIPASGWLADRCGVRRVYLAAIAVFTAASVLCALAPGLVVLCVVRAVQGIGGAMMVPVGRLAVLRAVDKTDLLDAIAYLTWPALLAPVVAPALGGVITDTLGWRWIFLINLPLGAAAVVAALRLVPAGAEPRAARLDWLGLGLVVVGVAALVTAGELVGEPSTPWYAGAAALLTAAVAGLLGWRHLRTTPDPLLDLRPLELGTFRVGNLGGGLYRLMITAAPFLFTLLFQADFGWSATRAGLVVIALFLGNLGIKPATSPLIRRFGFRAVIVWSNALGASILLAFVFVAPATPLPVILVLLLASGAVRSTGFSGYNTIQFVDVPGELTNHANTLSSTLQQLATGLGIAVCALLVRLGTTVADHTAGDPSLGYRWAFAGAAALLVVPLVEAMRLPAHAGSVAARR